MVFRASQRMSATSVSVGCASSTSATLRHRSKWALYRPVAVLTPIPWFRVQATMARLSSTTRALPASESGRRWRAASMPLPAIRELRFSELMSLKFQSMILARRESFTALPFLLMKRRGPLLAYGAVAITVMTHRKPVERISVMTLPFSPRRTSRQEPAPVTAFCSILPIPEIQSESMS